MELETFNIDDNKNMSTWLSHAAVVVSSLVGLILCISKCFPKKKTVCHQTCINNFSQKS